MRPNSSSDVTVHDMLHQVVPFFGRETEVADLNRMLEDSTCRLVTLIGPGGMGKTRLALRVAQQAVEEFADGVQWVDLQPVLNDEHLVQAIADAFGLMLAQDPPMQLSSFLKNKNLLLILDNFEYLLDAAPLLTTLLGRAPGLKILVTSREALNLREEWVHHLEGLPYPTQTNCDDLEHYPSVQLFTASARRVSPDFALEKEQDAVIQICRHVAGMPLALELAAAWTDTLNCTEIANEIQKGLDLFTTQLRNIPERQRSMQIIFDQTCAMLTAEQFNLFKRLSVFRGGFSREAATQVAGASLPVLAALIDKALLSRSANGRYHMHRLVAQYAAAQLAQSPEEVQQIKARHCEYYMGFLQDLMDAILGREQKSAIAAIKIEMDNLRAAWQQAIETVRVDAIQQGANTFAEFCQIQSRFREAAEIYEKAAQCLDKAVPTEQSERLQVLIKTYQAGFYLRVGRLAEARQISQECIAIYQSLGIPPLPGFSTDPVFNLGILALTQGNFTAAMEYGLQARQTSETYHHSFNRQLAYHLMTEAAIGLGDYENAQQHAQRSLALLFETGNRWFMAYTYNQMGRIARALSDHETAQHYYQSSLTIREEFEDQEGTALALSLLGENALLQSAYEDALQFFDRSIAIYRVIGDSGGLAKVLNGAAAAAIAVQDYQAAQIFLKEALEIAAKIEFISLMLFIIMSIAELLICLGDKERATELLALVSNHPAAGYETGVVLQRILQRYDLELLPGEVKANLTEVVSHLLLLFPEVPDEAGAVKSIPVPKFKQHLIEPLSEREQEVLYYIAQGLTNRAIAQTLEISPSTIKTHINSLYGKLGVRSRIQAISRAEELNLI
ncbi:MAG: tetratricopeptide repeat protein [Anaerolineae bacterium]|nr:tetratricopeptide repeat protein [Anaerolineae bacterium]